MATAFIGLVLITLIGNTVITKSKTKWWRDPASLFHKENEPELVAEVVPARRNAQARQPWEVQPRQETRPRQESRSRREATPRAGRHAMRPTPAVPIEHAETEIIARIPSGPRY